MLISQNRPAVDPPPPSDFYTKQKIQKILVLFGPNVDNLISDTSNNGDENNIEQRNIWMKIRNSKVNSIQWKNIWSKTNKQTKKNISNKNKGGIAAIEAYQAGTFQGFRWIVHTCKLGVCVLKKNRQRKQKWNEKQKIITSKFIMFEFEKWLSSGERAIYIFYTYYLVEVEKNGIFFL